MNEEQHSVETADREQPNIEFEQADASQNGVAEEGSAVAEAAIEHEVSGEQEPHSTEQQEGAAPAGTSRRSRGSREGRASRGERNRADRGDGSGNSTRERGNSRSRGDNRERQQNGTQATAPQPSRNGGGPQL